MSMNILLVTPKNPKSGNYIVIPSISLGYLAANLRNSGYNVEILDCIKENYTYVDFETHIQKKHYDVIGFNAFSPSMNAVRSYLEIIRKNKNGTLTLIGGPHPIFEPVDTMKWLAGLLDYAFCGEAEFYLPQLLQLHETNKVTNETLSKIPNLVWRDGENILCNDKKVIDDLNINGIQAWDLIRPDTYPTAPNGIFSRRKHIAPIITTRGCPYPCTFCGVVQMAGKKIRKRSMDNLKEEILWLRDDFGIEEIHIMDDNFTFDPEYASQFCNMVLGNKITMPWAIPNGVRLDTLDAELVKLMEKAGCYSFAVGIESGTNRVLKLMKKHLTVEKIREQLEIISKNSHLRVTGFFILGYPGETRKEAEQTITFAKELKIHRANFFNFSPFPGSTAYDELKASGKTKDLNFDDLYIHSISFGSEQIPKELLAHLVKKAHTEFYLRPHILWGLMKEIKSLYQLKVIFKRAMAILLPKNMQEKIISFFRRTKSTKPKRASSAPRNA